MIEAYATPLRTALDAWAALCATAGRRSLTAASALTAGTAEQREALALALVALGYPEATRSPLTLAQTFRRVRGLRDATGRHLDMSHGSGSAIWYVSYP